MVNLSHVIPGTKQIQGPIVLLAHYDSKLIPNMNFIGANDAASSVALLLTLTKPIEQLQLPYDVQIVFVDGEEAFVEWNFHDSLYGSRQMAQDVRGVNIKAMIVVDMVADKDLSFIRSRGVDENLLSHMEQSLKEMNHLDKLESQWSYVMDDHTPFMEMGIPTLHLMDFTFGGKKQPGTFWHTEQDNMENISAESLSITGELILRILKKIQ
jgi:glutaminyl-peptide cyclotransferase